MIPDKQSAETMQKQDERDTYEIMKPMCPPSYHYSDLVTTDAIGHMMYS